MAFSEEGKHVTTMWLINRLVDAMFTVDMLLTFQVAYQESIDNGGHWVTNKRVIAANYLKGWFVIDFISIVPFWMIAFDFDDPMGLVDSETGAAPRTSSSVLRTAVLFRVVKLLRMLKLARILKASRVLQRALLDIATNQWEWTFSKLKLIRLFTTLVIFAHWQACIDGLLSRATQP